MLKISGAVGEKGAVNKPIDVMVVQHLLNKHRDRTHIGVPLFITGIKNKDTQQAIEAFQREVLLSVKPDGRVDPGGRTFRELVKGVPVAESTALLRQVTAAETLSSVPVRPGELGSSIGYIDRSLFLELYQREFGVLGGRSQEGLSQLIGFINGDFSILDIGWAAYMLATVKHECANKWRPIEEYGKGSGHTYGNTVTITDSKGEKHTNTYYGRGYVQLTWEKNYKTMSAALGKGEDLWIDPSQTLEPETAYEIMSYGMRHGSFSNHSLDKHINSSGCDYLNARKIINSLDKYILIAGYAERLELLLRVACFSSVSDPASFII